jgi:hypothetical protein
MDDKPPWYERLLIFIGVVLFCALTWLLLVSAVALTIGLFG